MSSPHEKIDRKEFIGIFFYENDALMILKIICMWCVFNLAWKGETKSGESYFDTFYLDYSPQHDFPKSNRTSWTMYGSRRFTYHHGTRSDFVSEHVSGEKNDEVDPSMAFCGMPEPSVEICIGALPAATLSTENKEENF